VTLRDLDELAMRDMAAGVNTRLCLTVKGATDCGPASVCTAGKGIECC